MRLGLIGYGTIARQLVGLLTVDPTWQITVLVRPQALDAARAHARETGAPAALHFVTSRAALQSENPDLVVECAGQSAVAKHVEPLLSGGTDCLIVSVGALADADLHHRLTLATRCGRSRMILPGGAIGGLDLLAALSGAGDVKVTYRGTKPPAAWKGTPAETRLTLDDLTQPTTIFTGTAREAATLFPKNANVVAALALAGPGFDNVMVTLVADPSAVGNRHSYEVRSPICTFSADIENTASDGNARTSMATVFSLLHEIRSYRAGHPVRDRDIGST
ncbi:aspartate dehydrogenase [Puniceibacterium confluentis]|uniref:aspartate dehydrogenase n=1 Tax=Puniceibacterium confluentis TaxID=1958944 RepID=UPI0011B688A1|nr:aspartate dehydrogenase [Puniceibacterium confluentis]